MEKFKGTKGNWELVGANDIKVDGILIACALGSHVKGVYTHTEECKANAKLIACAPEMLEMLENLAHGEVHVGVQEIRELIKKATE